MGREPKVEFRYCPTTCALRSKEVWAILTKQPDGSWRIVNCLDKDEGCFGLDCAFTTSGGQWPYSRSSTDPLSGRDPMNRRPSDDAS